MLKFKNMKNIEAKTPISGFENTKDQNQKRIREGKINNYKNHLSENDILYIKNKCVYENYEFV
jgi:flagellar assembly factor FliW